MWLVLLIYVIGMFITPVIMKKCFAPFKDETDKELAVTIICMLWPVALVFLILFKLFSLFVYIYDKV